MPGHLFVAVLRGQDVLVRCNRRYSQYLPNRLLTVWMPMTRCIHPREVRHPNIVGAAEEQRKAELQGLYASH